MENEKRIVRPLIPEVVGSKIGFEAYKRPSKLPPLDVDALSLEIYTGSDARRRLAIPTIGDWVFLIRYKGKEATVAGVAEEFDDLVVQQLQGSRDKGYRVMTGLNWLNLYDNLLSGIVEHPQTSYRRIVVPNISQIPGATEAFHIYDKFIHIGDFQPYPTVDGKTIFVKSPQKNTSGLSM